MLKPVKVPTEDDFKAVEDLMDGDDNSRNQLPSYYGDDKRLEFHNDIEYNHGTDLHVPKDYVLDGMGYTLHVIDDECWRRSGEQRKGNVGKITNLYIIWEDEKNPGNFEYAYFNSEGTLIGKDKDREGEGGPFTSMEELLNYIDEHNLW